MVVKFLADLTELGQDLWDSMQDFACRTVPPLPNCQPSTVILSSKILLWSLVSLLLSMYSRVLYIVHCHLISTFCGIVLPTSVVTGSSDWTTVSWISFLRVSQFQCDECLLSAARKIKGILLCWSDPAAVHLLVENMPQRSVFHSVTHPAGLINSDVTSETRNLLI